MKVKGTPYCTIWPHATNHKSFQVIDQRYLPHEFKIVDITTTKEAEDAIRDMIVRGAPLIGATAAFGMYLAALESAQSDNPDEYIESVAKRLHDTRPTAVNLSWALEKQLEVIRKENTPENKIKAALENAKKITADDIEICKKIGEAGLKIIEEIAERKRGEKVNILTHCNAGWLGCVDWGTATSPIYHAFEKGVDLHVWVDETRPRNQGGNLTAWELGEHGVPHTVIVDNTGGHLMQHNMVDMVIVGTDRTTRTGDVCNKIGTYLKALAAKDNNVPFYVALPSTTIDWKMRDGVKEIPIEERDENEVKYVQGFSEGKPVKVLVMPETSKAANYGFDVTPARLVTGLITERGICEANEKDMLRLFPEQK